MTLRFSTLSILLILTLAGCLLITGCDDYKGKLTAENFEKIHEKMPRKDVESLLGAGLIVPAKEGEPTGFFDKGGMVKLTTERWQDGKRSITVTFAGDEVAVKDRAGF